MFRPIFATGLSAGFIVGVLITLIQAVTTTPLLLHAEKYETGDGHAAQAWRDPRRQAVYAPGAERLSRVAIGSGLIRVHNDDALSETETWVPHDGVERIAYTTLANVLMSIGFAMLLVAAFALRGVPVNGRQGVLWGLGGFAVFHLAPALGLPPEVPGVMVADLEARQLWWWFAAVSTAVGLWLMVFGTRAVLPIIGIAVMVLPHLVGAPRPEQIGGNVPAELAGHFAAASIVVAAIFWAMLGWVSGRLYPS